VVGRIRLGTIAGAPLFADVGFFIGLCIVGLAAKRAGQDSLYLGSAESTRFAILAAGLFAASFFVHELGHALAARAERVRIREVRLSFMSGAVVHEGPQKGAPGTDFRIVVWGPAATALTIVVAAAAAVLFDGWTLDDLRTGLFERHSEGGTLIQLMIVLNAFLLAYNLIPALPFDGGGLLRSAIWWVTGSERKAARAMRVVGIVIAFGFVIAALHAMSTDDQGGVIAWGLTAAWLFQGARGGTARFDLMDKLGKVRIGDALAPSPPLVALDGSPEDAWRYTFEPLSVRYAIVVDRAGRYVGLAHRGPVEAAVQRATPPATMHELVAPRALDSLAEIVDAEMTLDAAVKSAPLGKGGALVILGAGGVFEGMADKASLEEAALQVSRR
jgi:Zn-dependent protease